MSDSLRPEDRDVGAPQAPQRKPGAFADIEDGVGHLFAALERGVINLVDRPGQGGEATGDTDDAVPKQALPPRAGTSYDEVLTPFPWRSLGWGVVIVVGLAVAYVGATFLQVWAASDDDERQPADAIAVLGAAQFDGTPSPVLAARLDHALELWHDEVADVIVTTGANVEGDRFTEGFSGYVYLLEAGVPDEALITIVDGVDTYEQLSATKAQLDARDLASVVVVSDGYHNHRVRAISNEIGLVAWVSPTGVEATVDDWFRETAAASIGRVIGFRRLSNYAD